MLQPFDNYVKAKRVVMQDPSPALAKSLKTRAQRRFNKIVNEGIDKENPDFSLESIYETIREAIQSLMAKAGYKPYSHEATIAFLGEFYNFTDIEIEKIDNLRKLRHDLIYYAKDITSEEVESLLVFTKQLFPKLLNAKEKLN